MMMRLHCGLVEGPERPRIGDPWTRTGERRSGDNFGLKRVGAT